MPKVAIMGYGVVSLKNQVVTVNKDLIATFGHELFQLAKINNVSLKFEAAVAGEDPYNKDIKYR